MQNRTEFELVKKEIEANDVTSLYFKAADGKKYNFTAGQYVDIRPPLINSHGKSYTISSSPSDELVRITIKRKGPVSSAIIDLNIGDKIEFEGPYGVFYPEKDMSDVVMLAGGIGITPFFSVIRDRVGAGLDSNITLLYSNKTKQDISFFEGLNKIASQNNYIKIVHCLTQEFTKDSSISEFTRINESIVNRYAAPSSDKNYYICGSIGFVADMWKMLKLVGISEENIYTESFY
jgi:ferredoxin-NADP reductase